VQIQCWALGSGDDKVLPSPELGSSLIEPPTPDRIGRIVRAAKVLTANGVETFIQRDDGFTPTPVISHSILGYNRGRSEGLADGIVVTPSHNPPTDGGFKYNPPNGGPADTDVTDWIQNRANELLRAGQKGVQRIDFDAALKVSTTHAEKFTDQSGVSIPGRVRQDCPDHGRK
jgi:alpha-D-glucose phosphate-specific phosphoglucomutase